ncbi:hypothetical protein QQP08_022894 [Theobroma cacao]|nr:hypothetical protein QQP08_022894 [Theobroma cacao]
MRTKSSMCGGPYNPYPAFITFESLNLWSFWRKLWGLVCGGTEFTKTGKWLSEVFLDKKNDVEKQFCKLLVPSVIVEELANLR